MTALLAPALPHCVLLTAEEAASMDDMGAFIDAVKTEVRGQFIALGFGNTAAGELSQLFAEGKT